MKKKLLGLALGFTMIILSAANSNAQDAMLGEVKMFAGNFAPRGWAFCDGQLLPISQNQALFSILGTTYGGDGRTTFGLPDMRGRVVVGAGNGPGLSPVSIGQKMGTETTTIIKANLPTQSAGNVTGISSTGIKSQKNNPDLTVLVPSGTPDSTPVTTINASGSGGGSQPVNNVQPSIGIKYIIALQGVFPSRS